MLLDSNIIIYAQQPKYLVAGLETFLSNGCFAASSISRLEVMGYWRNNEIEYQYFELFFQNLIIYNISAEIIEKAITLRRKRSMGLADSLIAATAMVHQLALVTHNTKDFIHLTDLKVIDPLI